MVTMNDVRESLRKFGWNKEKFERIKVTMEMDMDTFKAFMNGKLSDVEVVGGDGYNDDGTVAIAYVYVDKVV